MGIGKSITPIACLWRDQLSFQDLQGNELAFIRQKLISLGATYEIHRGGALGNGEDDVLILASTVVIDMVCHPDQQHS